MRVCLERAIVCWECGLWVQWSWVCAHAHPSARTRKVWCVDEEMILHELCAEQCCGLRSAYEDTEYSSGTRIPAELCGLHCVRVFVGGCETSHPAGTTVDDSMYCVDVLCECVCYGVLTIVCNVYVCLRGSRVTILTVSRGSGACSHELPSHTRYNVNAI